MSEARRDVPSRTPSSQQGRVKWLVLLVVLVFALGGAVGGFYWWRGAEALHGAPAESAEHTAPALEPGVIGFEPFTVNLADPDAQRFLRVDLRLLVDDAAAAREAAADDVRMLRLRSAILELLSQQHAEPLTTPEGKAVLKQSIAERATAILQQAKVTDVLFSEFVVQF